MGTMRSVSSLPSGTLSQGPSPGRSMTQSSSRSSSSPIRSPQARCSSNPSAASRRGEASRAAVSHRSASGGRKRGSGRGRRGMSEANSSRRVGASGQPHSLMSVRNRDGHDPAGLLGDGQDPAGLGVRRGGKAGQPRLDVAAPVQRRGDRVRVGAGEVAPNAASRVASEETVAGGR